jgi:hypothetical protein
MPVIVPLLASIIYTVYICLDVQRMMREQLWNGDDGDYAYLYFTLSLVIVLSLLSIPFWLSRIS